jgi:hypothetical protein
MSAVPPPQKSVLLSTGTDFASQETYSIYADDQQGRDVSQALRRPRLFRMEPVRCRPRPTSPDSDGGDDRFASSPVCSLTSHLRTPIDANRFERALTCGSTMDSVPSCIDHSRCPQSLASGTQNARPSATTAAHSELEPGEMLDSQPLPETMICEGFSRPDAILRCRKSHTFLKVALDSRYVRSVSTSFKFVEQLLTFL